MADKAFVYFIQSKITKRVKIGWAINPEKRLRDLQTGSAEGLTLLGKIHCRSVYDAKKTEGYLHNLFKDLRLGGEWFDYDPSLIAYLVDRAIILPASVDSAYDAGRESSKRLVYYPTLNCLIGLFEDMQKLDIPFLAIWELYREHNDINNFTSAFIKLVREAESVPKSA